jgi:hypothetical protein
MIALPTQKGNFKCFNVGSSPERVRASVSLISFHQCETTVDIDFNLLSCTTSLHTHKGVVAERESERSNKSP